MRLKILKSTQMKRQICEYDSFFSLNLRGLRMMTTLRKHFKNSLKKSVQKLMKESNQTYFSCKTKKITKPTWHICRVHNNQGMPQRSQTKLTKVSPLSTKKNRRVIKTPGRNPRSKRHRKGQILTSTISTGYLRIIT